MQRARKSDQAKRYGRLRNNGLAFFTLQTILAL
jgi:hypothetical protein